MNNSRLMTDDLRELVKQYPLYSQDGKNEEAVCIALFNIGNAAWFVLEGEEKENDCMLYGIVTGLQEDEYGYFSLKELEKVQMYGGECVVERSEMKPTKLKDVNYGPLQKFLENVKYITYEEV